MKRPKAAAMAIGLFLTQQAQAASFVVLSDGPDSNPRSVLMLGEQDSPAVAANAHTAPPPDRSIETSALRTTLDGPNGAATDAVSEPDDEARDVVAWPPVLSRSMVAFGEPLPARPSTFATGSRAPFSLPGMFRAGLAGDAFTSTRTPTRAAVQEERPVEPRPAGGGTARPDAPAMTERRDTAPPSRRDRTSAPDGPPTVPATPPPTMQLR